MYSLCRTARARSRVTAASLPRRNSSRKKSTLIAADDHSALASLLSGHNLTFEFGDNTEATALLETSFTSLGSSLLRCSGQRECIALRFAGNLVAAAVAQPHPDQKAIEVPIFATAREFRRRGFGSVLAALLVALGRQMGFTTYVIEATEESHVFWVNQGLRDLEYCAATAAAAVSALQQSGTLCGFSNSYFMASTIEAAAGEHLELHRALGHCSALAASDGAKKRATYSEGARVLVEFSNKKEYPGVINAVGKGKTTLYTVHFDDGDKFDDV